MLEGLVTLASVLYKFAFMYLLFLRLWDLRASRILFHVDRSRQFQLHLQASQEAWLLYKVTTPVAWAATVLVLRGYLTWLHS